MNTFFYLDFVKDDPIFYYIITDFSKEEIINFLRKKANEFCKQSDMDPEDFLNGNYDSNYFVTLKISNKIYFFSLFSILTDQIENRLTKEFDVEIIKINIEDIL